MHITELAHRTGVTVKAIRYYESIGLISPRRENNGYRNFDQDDVRIVEEIRALTRIGISPSKVAPFIECLGLGHEHGDECVSSLAVYRDTIAELDRMISSLNVRRKLLQSLLNHASSRTFDKEPQMNEYALLPSNLPVPKDEGAADDLWGMALPRLILPATDGCMIDLADLGSGRTVLYLYPLTGQPGVDLPEGWDSIPGARGCTTEACSFRDHYSDLRLSGAERVFGLSSQSPDYQAEVTDRLSLPFAMLSDQEMSLADALDLPTFQAPGHNRLYSRLTLVVRDGIIEHVFYPIFPPNTHAQQVLNWLKEN